MTEALLESEIVKFIRFYWEDCFIYIKAYLEKPNEFKQYFREIKPKWDSPKPFDWNFAQEDKKFDVAYIDGLINQFIRQNNLSKQHQIKLLNEVLADFELKKVDFSCYDTFLKEDYVEINYKVELQYIKAEVNNTTKHLKEKLGGLNKETESHTDENKSKPANSIMVEEREKLMLKLEEQDKQAEINRIKCFESYIDKNYNYSPTLEDFKEELLIQKRNKSANELLLFLRETKKVYGNANHYYTIWGARGTGIDRGELYSIILKLIQEEIDSNLENTPPQQNNTVIDWKLETKELKKIHFENEYKIWRIEKLENSGNKTDKRLAIHIAIDDAKKLINQLIRKRKNETSFENRATYTELIQLQKSSLVVLKDELKKYPVLTSQKSKEKINLKPQEAKNNYSTLQYALFHYYLEAAKLVPIFKKTGSKTKRETMKEQGKKYGIGGEAFAVHYYCIAKKANRISKTNIDRIRSVIEMLSNHPKGKVIAETELKEAELLS